MTQNVMSGYYGQPYQQSIDPNRPMDSFMQQGMVPDMVQGMIDTTMGGDEGQTLDEIISQNDRELQRRRSTYHPDLQSNGSQQTRAQRSATLDFAASKHPDRPDFHFDQSPAPTSMPGQRPETGRPQKGSDPRKARSRENLALDTHFNQLNPAFASMANYSPAMMTSTPPDLDPTSQFLSSNLEIPMSFDSGGGGDRTPMNIQPQIEQQPLYTASPTHQCYSPAYHGLGHDSPVGHGSSMEQSFLDKVSRMRMPDSMQNMSIMNGQATSPHHVMPNKRGSNISLPSPALPPPTSVPPNANLGIRSTYDNGGK
jgi:hypothetical protein